MDLEDFIRMPRLWQWGGTPVERKVDGVLTSFAGDDCTTFAGSWFSELTGVDPAAALRGTYSSPEEANAIVAAHGGMTRLGAAMLEPHGARRVRDLMDGDIGIILAASAIDLAVKEIPAIRFGPLWAVMAPRGAMVKKLEWTGLAWRVEPR